MKSIGIMMIVAGGVLAAAGLLFVLIGKFPFMGSLPGDINVRWKNISFSFPLMTCVILSVILTLVLNAVFRLMNK